MTVRREIPRLSQTAALCGSGDAVVGAPCLAFALWFTVWRTILD